MAGCLLQKVHTSVYPPIVSNTLSNNKYCGQLLNAHARYLVNDAHVMCKARIRVRNFSMAAVQFWCSLSNRRALLCVHLYNVIVQSCARRECVAQKAWERATLGAPFNFGAREHQSRTFGRNIAGRRVCSILGLNQVFERGVESNWLIYMHQNFVNHAFERGEGLKWFIYPLNCEIHRNGKVWIAAENG